MTYETAGCFSAFRPLFTHFLRKARPNEGQDVILVKSSTATEFRQVEPTNDHQLINRYILEDFSSEGNGFSLLEQPPSYDGSIAPFIHRPDVMATIEAKLEELNDQLRDLSLKIHDHPELGFEEVFAHDTLTSYMRSKGFEVTTHYAGLKTAWKAEWASGMQGRIFGINSEMDALPGIGHGCGHNLIAMAGVGVAIAAKAAMQKHGIPGKIILLGTPAEEGGGGKALLLERGAYKDMDFCVMCHPAPGPPNSALLGPTLSTQSLIVEYFGHPAHAAAAPWEGQNALDAAVLAYNNVSVLRQQIKPSCRVHGIIEGRNWAPNIIPDYAKMRWIVRAPSYTEMADLLVRVKSCIEAAAIASSCRCEISFGVPYYDLRQNAALRRGFSQIVKEHYGMSSIHGEGSLGASTDFGNVAYKLPALHPAYSIPTVPSGGNHTAEFAKSARAMEAHKATMTVMKGLALLGVHALDDDMFFKEVKDTFNNEDFEPIPSTSSVTKEAQYHT